MLIDILKPDFNFTDDRGTLTQIVHGGYNQVNAVFSKKGAVRGGFHYHKLNDEVFFVLSGRLKLTAQLNDKTEEYIFNPGDMFCVNKNVRHCFLYLEDTYIIGLYSGCVELSDGTKDIYTD